MHAATPNDVADVFIAYCSQDADQEGMGKRRTGFFQLSDHAFEMMFQP